MMTRVFLRPQVGPRARTKADSTGMRHAEARDGAPVPEGVVYMSRTRTDFENDAIQWLEGEAESGSVFREALGLALDGLRLRDAVDAGAVGRLEHDGYFRHASTLPLGFEDSSESNQLLYRIPDPE